MYNWALQLRRYLVIAGILVVMLGFPLLLFGLGLFEPRPPIDQYLSIVNAPCPPPIIVPLRRNTYIVFADPMFTPETSHTDNPLIVVYDQSQNLVINESLILAGTVYDSQSGSTQANYRYAIRINSAEAYNITFQGLIGYRLLIAVSPFALPPIDIPPVIGAFGLFIAGASMIGFGATMEPKNNKRAKTSAS